MTYGGSNYYRMPSPLGDLLIWSFGRDPETGLTGVGIRTEHEHNRSPYRDAPVNGGWEGMPTSVTLHRVTYTAHDSMRVNDAGEVVSFGEAGALYRSNAKRGQDMWPANYSPAAKKWREAIGPAVTAFLQSETGQAMLAEGHSEALARDIREAREEVSKLRAQLSEAETRLSDLEARA